MDGSELALFIVITVAIVIQAIFVVATLTAGLLLMKKLRKVADEVQRMTEKGSIVAERLAPLGGLVVGLAQAMRIVMRKRKKYD